MTIRNSFLAAPLAVLALAVPGLAQQGHDMSSMTCGELKAMDDEGKMAASTHAGYVMSMHDMSDEDKHALEDHLGQKLENLSDRERYNALYSAVEEAETHRISNLNESDREHEEKVSMDRLEMLLTACENDDAMLINDVATGMKTPR